MRIADGGLTGALYNKYQSCGMDGMSYTDFYELVRSKSSGGSFTSPEGQLWTDYLDWKAARPQRSLPGSEGPTEENIAYLKEHFSGSLDIFRRIDALDTMAQMGIITKEEMFGAIGFAPGELTQGGREKIKSNGTPEEERARFMEEVSAGWKGLFSGAPVMGCGSLEELFKLLDRQLEDSQEKGAAEEIRDVLEQVAKKSFGACWGVV